MENISISIIIPVYNTELYLNRCIDSCLNQTLDNIEIIIIDDKSTDESPNIIRKYQEKHPEIIKTLFQPFNMKQGAARNRGIKIASGKYIMFVDSDDWIAADACEILYNKAVKNNADMVCGNMWRVSKEGEKNEINIYDNRNDLLGSLNKEKKEEILRLSGLLSGLFWSRIYKRELIVNHNIRFSEGIIFEDTAFNIITFLHAKNIYKVEYAFYYYYERVTSSIHTEGSKYDHKFKAADTLYNNVIEMSLFEKYKDIVLFRMLNFYVDALCGALSNDLNDYDQTIIAENQKKYRLLKSGKYFKSLNLNMKILLFINSFSPKLASFFYTKILI